MFAQTGRPVQGRLDSARSDLTTGRSQSSKTSSRLREPTEAFQVSILFSGCRRFDLGKI